MASNRILRAPHPTASAQWASIAPQPLQGALDIHHIYKLTQQLSAKKENWNSTKCRKQGKGHQLSHKAIVAEDPATALTYQSDDCE